MYPPRRLPRDQVSHRAQNQSHWPQSSRFPSQCKSTLGTTAWLRERSVFVQRKRPRSMLRTASHSSISKRAAGVTLQEDVSEGCAPLKRMSSTGKHNTAWSKVLGAASCLVPHKPIKAAAPCLRPCTLCHQSTSTPDTLRASRNIQHTQYTQHTTCSQ